MNTVNLSQLVGSKLELPKSGKLYPDYKKSIGWAWVLVKAMHSKGFCYMHQTFKDGSNSVKFYNGQDNINFTRHAHAPTAILVAAAASLEVANGHSK